jgi:hypothetical protein
MSSFISLFFPTTAFYFSGIFLSNRYGEKWGYGVHPKLSDPDKYPS